MRPATIKHLHSAGGVIFRITDRGFEAALIAIKNKSIWTLPKGIIDKGEKAETISVREIKEETGLTGRIIDTLGDKSYWFYMKGENTKCRKTVTYFLLEYESGSTEDYIWEVDDAKWFDLDDAIKQVSYKTDREILKKAKEKLEQYGTNIRLDRFEDRNRQVKNRV